MTRPSSLTNAMNLIDHRTRLTLLVVVASTLLLAVLYSLMDRHLENLARRRIAREKTLLEIMPLRQRYREARQGLLAREAKIAGMKGDETIGSILEGTGIRGKNGQVRLIPSTEKGVERGEIRIDSITPNELVNLLYRLEYGPKPISLTRGSLKVRFDDPSRIDLSLTATLLRPEKANP